MERQVHGSSGAEQEVDAERRLAARNLDAAAMNCRPGGEMPPLVELAVIRQISLGDDAENLAPVDDEGRIVELAVPAERRSDDEQREKFLRGFDQLRDAALDRPQQRILEQQVLDRIGG